MLYLSVFVLCSVILGEISFNVIIYVASGMVPMILDIIVCLDGNLSWLWDIAINSLYRHDKEIHLCNVRFPQSNLFQDPNGSGPSSPLRFLWTVMFSHLRYLRLYNLLPLEVIAAISPCELLLLNPFCFPGAPWSRRLNFRFIYPRFFFYLFFVHETSNLLFCVVFAINHREVLNHSRGTHRNNPTITK